MARLSVEENGWDLPDELKNQRILLVQMEKVVTESMERTSANKDDDVAKFVSGIFLVSFPFWNQRKCTI
jgi:hypothetical protein